MTERLLQFIWQFQYFNKTELQTSSGETVQVIFAGQYNTNQGPDFSDAKIKIGHTTWAGSVELHIKTSGWIKHKHETDKNYSNVILHVVWENDNKANEIPVLELSGKVSKILLDRYGSLMNAGSFIPCEETINTIPALAWKSWRERLLVERLLRKSGIVADYLAENNCHWEETFWWMLARNFGFSVNADALEAVARSVPLKILAKHKAQIQQLEALLMGQTGLLDGVFTEDYPILLQREYKFLKDKYKLKQIHQPVHFLRMRPGNFPTIRLAQLAMLVQRSAHLFSRIKDTTSLKDIRQWFDVTANDYWHYHYTFDEGSAFKKKNLGSSMIDNIIINTVCPVLFAYGNYNNENKYKESSLEWLEQTGAESNNITKGFIGLGIENKNAFDSQGLIELKTQYCDKKMCLDCGVGNSLLKV